MKNHRISRIALATSLGLGLGLYSLGATAQGSQTASLYSGMFVFGDSLSDSGNNFTAFFGATGPAPTSNTFIPTFPYSSGTYSNGPTWVSGLAAGLGLPAAAAAPSLLGGGNYAYGGATVANGAPFPPSLQNQLSSYLTSGPAVSPTALYVIAGGGNDARAVATAILGGADPVAATLAGATAYAASTAQMVGSLRAAGASNIIVWNVPDLGKTPTAGAGVGPAAEGGTQVSTIFNSFLSVALTGSGATIFDVFGIVGGVVANPGTFGFGNVTQACGFAGNGCDASTALFWDGIHPTAFAQNYIAGQMLAVAVPEPGSVWLFMAGLLAFGLMVRRRSQG